MPKPLKIKKEDLNRVFIETNKSGFTIWIKEKDGRQHWLVDGSTVLEDGIIALGQADMYEHQTKVLEEYADRGRCVIFTRKK